MKCSVFIATSADGYIATMNGDIDWLEKAGKPDAVMGDFSDMGFGDFVSSIDCIIMGRKCMEKLASFNLPAEQWPYGQIPIFVLSHSIKGASEIIKDKIEMFSEEIPILITQLKSKGFQHAYIDGGSTITSFLNLELINEITITQAPVLLGNGIPLFGKTKSHIKLEDAQAKEYPNDFIQIKYKVKALYGFLGGYINSSIRSLSKLFPRHFILYTNSNNAK